MNLWRHKLTGRVKLGDQMFDEAGVAKLGQFETQHIASILHHSAEVGAEVPIQEDLMNNTKHLEENEREQQPRG